MKPQVAIFNYFHITCRVRGFYVHHVFCAHFVVRHVYAHGWHTLHTHVPNERRLYTNGTDLLLGVWGVVRVYEGYRLVEHGTLKLLYSICVRLCMRVRTALLHGVRGRRYKRRQ